MPPGGFLTASGLTGIGGGVLTIPESTGGDIGDPGPDLWAHAAVATANANPAVKTG